MAVVEKARPSSTQMNQMLKSPSFEAPKAPAFNIPTPPFEMPQKSAVKSVGKP